MNLSKNVDIKECCLPVGAAIGTDQNSDRIDMQDWDGAVFIVPITDSDATGVATMTIEQNTSDSDSGMAALSGASATKTCVSNDDLNNQLLIVDIYKPLERYIQAVITSATANIAFGNMIVILYQGRKIPASDDDSVLDATLVVSPAEA